MFYIFPNFIPSLKCDQLVEDLLKEYTFKEGAVKTADSKLSSKIQQGPDSTYRQGSVAFLKPAHDYIHTTIDDCITKANNNYFNWYSTLPHCVVYFTGKRLNMEENNFTGANTVIPQRLGLKIFNLLVELGANLNIENYYMRTVYDYRNYEDYKFALSGRTNNETLIARIEELYNNHNDEIKLKQDLAIF